MLLLLLSASSATAGATAIAKALKRFVLYVGAQAQVGQLQLW